MSTVRITPSTAARLEFFVLDSSYLPVPSLGHSDVSAASYITRTAGVDASPVSCTPTSSAASTASISAGQFITIDSARGHYAIDCAAGAALITADTVRLSVTMAVGTYVVRVVRHEILYKAKIDSAGLIDATMVKAGLSGSATTQSSGDIYAGVASVSSELMLLSTVFSGISSLGNWLRRIVRKDAGTAAMIAAEAEINTGGTATFDGTADSMEAIRDRGDASWATATGFSTHSASDVLTALGTGTGLTAIPWNPAWDAEVQSEVQDAIEANHLDHLFASAYDPASKPGNASGLLNVLVENDGGVPRYTVNALEQAPSGGGGSSAWTEEDVTYALEKLALLGVVADAVVVPAGTFMCGRGDIEQIFGTTAVAKWGDLNNNEDADEITARINYRISIADSFMRSTLGNSAWILPEEGDEIPPILAYYTACLAGVLLYEGRGVQDYDARGNAVHQLSFHKKSVDDFVKGVLFGAVSLDPLERNVVSAAPEAV